MYILPDVRKPKDMTFSEYTISLMDEIKNNRDKDSNMELLFSVSYPIMLSDLKSYTNLLSIEELEGYIPIAFMKTVNNFDPNAKKASFVGYYKMVLFTEIMQGYYGKYRHTEELRELKRKIDSTVSPLDTPVYDKHGQNTGTWHDLLEDSIDVEADLLDKEFINDIISAINSTFSPKKKGLCNQRTIRPKQMFTDYIMAHINGEKATSVAIADKYGVSKSAVSNIVYKYMPEFKKELKKRGYDL